MRFVRRDGLSERQDSVQISVTLGQKRLDSANPTERGLVRRTPRPCQRVLGTITLMAYSEGHGAQTHPKWVKVASCEDFSSDPKRAEHIKEICIHHRSKSIQHPVSSTANHRIPQTHDDGPQHPLHQLIPTILLFDNHQE